MEKYRRKGVHKKILFTDCPPDIQYTLQALREHMTKRTDWFGAQITFSPIGYYEGVIITEAITIDVMAPEENDND